MLVLVFALTIEEISVKNPAQAILEYSETPPNNYTVVDLIPGEAYFNIKIDPCREDQFDCCQEVNEGGCQDNLVVEGGENVSIAWAYNNVVVICNNQFSEVEFCGLFLETHRPFDSDVLVSIRVQKLYSDGFHMESIQTQGLVPGEYEIWTVERTRYGVFLIYVKPFYII